MRASAGLAQRNAGFRSGMGNTFDGKIRGPIECSKGRAEKNSKILVHSDL